MENIDQLRLFDEDAPFIKPYTKQFATKRRAESIGKNLREVPDELVFWK